MDDHGDYQEVMAEKTINRKLHQKIKRKGIGTTDWIEARKFNMKKIWVVQRVIDRKKEGGIFKYLCKFQNFGSWWNEWLTRENFLIPDMLNDYDENDDDDDDQQPTFVFVVSANGVRLIEKSWMYYLGDIFCTKLHPWLASLLAKKKNSK